MKRTNQNTVRWLWRVTGKKKGYILALTLIQGAAGLIGVAYALLLRAIVDSAVGKDPAAFRHNVMLIVGLVLIQLGINAVIRWLYELAKADIENTFKQRLTDNILRKEYASVSAVHTAEWLNRLTNDTAVVAGGAVEILPGLVGTVVRLISALVMIIALDRWFAYILIPGGIMLIVLTYAFRGVLKRLHKNIQETDGALRIYLQERISSLMVIKAFTAEAQTGEGAGAQGGPSEAKPLLQYCQYRFWRSNAGNVPDRGGLLCTRHHDGAGELRYPDRRHAAHRAGAGAFRQHQRLSAPLVCHDSQRRALDGSGALRGRRDADGEGRGRTHL